MGSSGSGSFTDYSENKPKNSDIPTGGSGNIDKCSLAFATSLEEVSRCNFYKNSKTLPRLNSEVLVIFNGLRLAVVENSSKDEIGYLPTKFNYIKACIDNGFVYTGVVRSSSLTPTPTVLVDIIPS